MSESLVSAIARAGYAPHAATVGQALSEEGHQAPGPLFPIIFEFMQFQARCRAQGFAAREILELAKRLAERHLDEAARDA